MARSRRGLSFSLRYGSLKVVDQRISGYGSRIKPNGKKTSTTPPAPLRNGSAQMSEWARAGSVADDFPSPNELTLVCDSVRKLRLSLVPQRRTQKKTISSQAMMTTVVNVRMTSVISVSSLSNQCVDLISASRTLDGTRLLLSASCFGACLRYWGIFQRSSGGP